MGEIDPVGHAAAAGVAADSRLILLTGATATGKTEVAVALAQQVGGEIVSVDSMQVYRGLDIGTAKPTPVQRRRAPHHLIDVVGLDESFDAARFVTLARQAVEDIIARGRVPILCGGTGLYFKAYLEGLGEAPPADPALRAELEKTPLADLLRELAEADPVTYEKIDRQNPRRVVRAVEVIRLTGRPFSKQRARWRKPDESSRNMPRIIGLLRDHAVLRERINQRVEDMFQLGLVEETRTLMRMGLAENPTARQALGYKQVIEHLRRIRGLNETITLVKVRTWQFARRQMAWFRRQLAVEWLEVPETEDPEKTARRVLELHGKLSR